MDTNSPEAWFKNLPIVTRSLLVVTFSATCLVAMGILDPYLIVLDWKLVTNKYVIYDEIYNRIYLDIIYGVCFRRRCSLVDSRSGLSCSFISSRISVRSLSKINGFQIHRVNTCFSSSL